MNNSSSTTPTCRRALVLGGGGSTGNAWLIGVIAGLADSGVQLTEADVLIGTSAGATAAAQITGFETTGTTIAELYEASLVVPARAHVPATTASASAPPPVSTVDYLALTNSIIAKAAGPEDMRRRMCTAALEADTGSEAQSTKPTLWQSIAASRLPGAQWSAKREVLITAVDTTTAEGVVFDRHGSVSLVDAVAASTSTGFGAAPPLRLGASRFIDGGYRRNENADLAMGCDRVLVLAPFGGRSRTPEAWGLQLSAQIDELTAAGSEVTTLFPGRDNDHLFGPNAMDHRLRPEAARLGWNQGVASANRLRSFWTDAS